MAGPFDFPDLTPLLSPRSVAVVGAISGTDRAGGRPLPYSERCGFKGLLYPVNPSREEVDGRRCYPSIADLPETPELAVIVVRASRAVEAIQEAIDAGVAALVILTAGFREAGSEGARMEDEIVRRATAAGTIICGPNSLGVANLHSGLFASFSSALDGRSTEPGPVAFVSQSGMLGGLAMSELTDRDVGLGAMVSVGNEAGVEIADAIAHFSREPSIRVIGGYVEGARDGQKLLAALSLAHEAGKRVVLLKVGRTADAIRAAHSHTGALAGVHRIYRSAFEMAGVIEAQGEGEMFDFIETATRISTPASTSSATPGIAVFTNSGGFGALAADVLPEAGLSLTEFTASTEKRLRERLPPFVRATNPVDVALQAIEKEEALVSHVEAFVDDPGVDGILGIFGLYRPRNPAFADAVCSFRENTDKPLMFVLPHSTPDLRRRFLENGVPVFNTVEQAVRAMASVFRIPAPEVDPIPIPADADSVLTKILEENTGAATLSEGEGMDLLDTLGIQTCRLGLAKNAAEVVRIAGKTDGRVVLKVESREILHKTEVGGVILGIEGKEEVSDAFARIFESVKSALPAAKIEGVGVHRVVAGAVELLVGVRRDPAFGPVALVGAGGTSAEVLDDVIVRPTPIGLTEADAMIRSLQSFPLLDGARGSTSADVAAAAHVLAVLAAFADAFPSVSEIEINPLFVCPAGEGVAAGDALVVLDSDVSTS